MKPFAFLLFAACLSACSPKPVLFPNSFYKEKDQESVQRDIQDCKDLAAEHLRSHESASPSQASKDYIDTCLIHKGYQPMGWK